VPSENFICAELSKNPFPNNFFDAVISIAVLHFAQNKAHFTAQWHELIRVCRPGGILFLRMSTLMGMDYEPEPEDNDRFRLRSSDIWYLPNQIQLEQLIQSGGLQILEPMKSVCVHGQRSMTTLILKKPA
jgi:ubiquinone/menaquinone biosynthesis C-methylase UbiE